MQKPDRRDSGAQAGCDGASAAQVEAASAFILHSVARAHGVTEAALRAPSRGRAAVALARQVMMYLGHVSCGIPFTEIGRVIGRDRSTAAHACHAIEDRREEALLDAALDYLDAALRARLGYLGAATAAGEAS